MSKVPPPSLEAAKNEFSSQNLLSILGTSGTGKTVVASLLLEAIVNKFLPGNKDYDFHVSTGLQYMKINSLSLQDGKFPPRTAESDINHVEMVLTQQPSGGKIFLRFNDISGELQASLLSGDLSGESLCNRIVEYQRQKAAYGPFSFLIFCKAYVFLIDCEDFTKWPKLQFDYMQLINNLLNMKKFVEGAENDKIKNPIAIMFTKSDLLDTKDREKKPDELLHEYMPKFSEHIKSLTSDLSFFKVFLDVERGTDNKPIEVSLEIKPDQDVQNPPKQEADSQQTEQAQDKQQKQETTYKVIVPLSYSEDQYVNFISWLDKKLKQ